RRLLRALLLDAFDLGVSLLDCLTGGSRVHGAVNAVGDILNGLQLVSPHPIALLLVSHVARGESHLYVVRVARRGARRARPSAVMVRHHESAGTDKGCGTCRNPNG